MARKKSVNGFYLRFKNTRRESGATTVETILAASAVIVIVTGLMMAGYMAFAKIWIHHSSYEAVICLAAHTQKAQCRKELQLKIHRLLPSASLTQIQLERSPREARVRFELKLLNDLRLSEKRKIRLPLILNDAGRSRK